MECLEKSWHWQYHLPNDGMSGRKLTKMWCTNMPKALNIVAATATEYERTINKNIVTSRNLEQLELET